MRFLTVLTLTLAACGTRYPCCIDGVTSDCLCPPGTQCMQARFQEFEDGTCSMDFEMIDDTADTAD